MRWYHIFVFGLLMVVSSASTGGAGFLLGYYEALKKSELDKEAAVKGAVYDAQEELSKQALDQAQAYISENTKSPDVSIESQKLIEDFYDKTNEGDYEQAWELLSSSYQKSLRSVSKLKRDFLSTESVIIKEIEYRTSSKNSALYAVSIETTLSTGKVKPEDYFIRTITEDISGKWKIDSIDLSE